MRYGINEQNSSFLMLCKSNYRSIIPPSESGKNFIGFTNINSVIYIFPIIALILNLFSIINYLLSRKRPKLSMEKMMFYLTIFETIISFYWITNIIWLGDINELADSIDSGKTEKCSKCYISSIFSVFFQNFDWMIFICSLYNLYKFFQDPAHEKSGYPNKFKWYIGISFGSSFMYTYFVFIAEIFGLSPMLTCYIKNYSTIQQTNDTTDLIKIYSILIMPLFYIVSTIYLFVRLYKSRLAIKKHEFRREIYKFLAYAFIYAIFYFPTILLYIITINKQIERSTVYSWFSYFCFHANLALNAILSIFRIFQGHTSINFIGNFQEENSQVSFLNESYTASERSFSFDYRTGKFDKDYKLEINPVSLEGIIENIDMNNDFKEDEVIKEKNNRHSEANDFNINLARDGEENLINYGRAKSKTVYDIQILNHKKNENYKKKIKRQGSLHNINSENIKILTNNIFIGLTHSLINSMHNEVKIFLSPRCFIENVTYSVKKDNFNMNNFKNFPPQLIDDEMDIEVIEYAPSVFRKLRDLDGLDNKEIYKSLNIDYKAKISDSQGYSQALFISTKDHRYILKTLKEKEFDNIFDKYLFFYLNYLEKNPDSLLCRIYGIFKIKPSYNSDHLLFILLRNAKGPFNRHISITYDLKGSTRGRKTPIPSDISSQKKVTRKDVNFLEDEKDFRIENRNKLLEICRSDAKFLEDFTFMDYSLFVVKLTFDKDSIKWIENFKKSSDYKYYSRYMYKNSDSEYSYNIFCIIDYFQVYDFTKNVENKVKLIGNNYSDIPDISCVPPDIYCYRFIKFLEDNIK